VPCRFRTSNATVVADRALGHLGGRPLGLVRMVKGRPVYHRGKLPTIPATVRHKLIPRREGGRSTRIWVDDLAGLLGTVEMGAVELHPWGMRIDDVAHPDMLVFNLKPGPDTPQELVVATALALRRVLRDEGCDPWPKTTGEVGVHVMVPVAPRRTADAAREWTRTVAERIASRDPRCTLAATEARAGRLLVDYLRNGHGKTTLGAFSPLARPGWPISHPITWKQLESGIAPDRYKVRDFI
jgi:bifunctional non-homologous end joining protein LigD